MTIEGRNLRAVGEALRQNLNAVLTSTISYQQLSPIYGTHQMTLSFRDAGRPASIPLTTRWGQWWLYIGLICGTEAVGRNRVRLQTLAYRYTIATAPDVEPIPRWEYVRPQSQARDVWSRHHIQGAVEIAIGENRSLSLNDMHVPTGWVAIEEVIRFCIVDLGVQPHDERSIATEDGATLPAWHLRLIESIEKLAIPTTNEML